MWIVLKCIIVVHLGRLFNFSSSNTKIDFNFLEWYIKKKNNMYDTFQIYALYKKASIIKGPGEEFVKIKHFHCGFPQPQTIVPNEIQSVRKIAMMMGSAALWTLINPNCHSDTFQRTGAGVIYSHLHSRRSICAIVSPLLLHADNNGRRERERRDATPVRACSFGQRAYYGVSSALHSP